jgi:hypothetical protein
MLGFGKKSSGEGGAFAFRVSDVVDVPLRGIVLRLRLLEGSPALADLGVGSALQLRAPDGTERRVTIAAHPVTGGKPSQARLDRTREFDVLIAEAPGSGSVPTVEIGWTARGPVS